jgi:lipid A disaccharide synthetase
MFIAMCSGTVNLGSEILKEPVIVSCTISIIGALLRGEMICLKTDAKYFNSVAAAID